MASGPASGLLRARRQTLPCLRAVGHTQAPTGSQGRGPWARGRGRCLHCSGAAGAILTTVKRERGWGAEYKLQAACQAGFEYCMSRAWHRGSNARRTSVRPGPSAPPAAGARGRLRVHVAGSAYSPSWSPLQRPGDWNPSDNEALSLLVPPKPGCGRGCTQAFGCRISHHICNMISDTSQLKGQRLRFSTFPFMFQNRFSLKLV